MPDRHPLIWLRIGDQAAGDHFVALDERCEDVGILRESEDGCETEPWAWWMTRQDPGPPVPRSGTCPTRGEAARELIECWQAFRKYYRLPN